MYNKKLVSIARRYSPKGLQKLRGIRSRIYHQRHRREAAENFLTLCERFNQSAQAPFDGTNHIAVPTYGVPESIHGSPAIEINNTCNIDCAMCQTSLATRKKGKMKKDVVDKVFERLEPYKIDGVELHTIGDPLANPNLESVLQNLREHSLTTAITTNGLLLKRHVDTILKYLDVVIAITFSIDGATKETYERIRLGGKWENLLESLEIARTQLSDHLPIHISMVVSADNCHEIGSLIEKFRPYVFDPGNNFHFGVLNSLSPDNSYFEKFNLFKNHTRKNIGCGYITGRSLFFHISGDVSICCRDYDGSLVIGNVNDGPLDGILGSQKLKDLQTAHETADLSSHSLCDTCYVVDDTVSTMVPMFLRALILQNPDAPAAFYQDALDELVVAINSGHTNPELLTSRLSPKAVSTQ